ncbi:hypothetical protein GHT06_004935 [Daphnia sinensis]|uniref:Uncharacterized protein n=1 Tax=Daphnia sinensis TaxID=1820382 RepID=A0AAD5KW49_9CRUS|nr:hypothetical protein GHT06_004935 [Daphnia sinensis]
MGSATIWEVKIGPFVLSGSMASISPTSGSIDSMIIVIGSVEGTVKEVSGVSHSMVSVSEFSAPPESESCNPLSKGALETMECLTKGITTGFCLTVSVFFVILEQKHRLFGRLEWISKTNCGVKTEHHFTNQS